MPMGTIVTVCMLVALLLASPYVSNKVRKPLSPFIAVPAALVICLLGAWNVFWYAARHINEFWGIAALVSGLLMIVTAGYIADYSRMPKWLQTLRPAVLIALFDPHPV